MSERGKGVEWGLRGRSPRNLYGRAVGKTKVVSREDSGFHPSRRGSMRNDMERSGLIMAYVHGYSDRENERLEDQSSILEELLHSDTVYPQGSKVLEAGCGVGAQTGILARRSPLARFTSIDMSEASLAKAKAAIEEEGMSNVHFKKDNIMDLSFGDGSFDHVFVCFVLEHLDDPLGGLLELKRVLKLGGTITVIEGDHDSCIWHPETRESRVVWNSLVIAQQQLGHDPLIGRRVYPLLIEAGFAVRNVMPKCVYADALIMEDLDGGVNKIMVPMVESAKQQVLESGIVDSQTWDKGIKDLSDVGRAQNGTLFYSWFKGVAVKE